ncbi:nucleoprotein [Kismaayo virus]|uniref:Nucleoprotein n=1 Tax=Kismaayo virus TaxID=2847813 RepID=A0A097SRX1_9VIRU|nr:nucleoprotein [Kismaayo virus]AIU95035.1 nucleoprotein [Kismaayo virus]
MPQTYGEILNEFGNFVLDDDALNDLEGLFAYQGFDPVRMLKRMAEKDMEGWKDDAKVIIVFALTRGNKMRKAMAKMSDEGKTKLTALKQKYGLKENPESRDDITPTRVAAALPTWTVRAAKALKNSLPMGPDNVLTLAKLPIPAEMCCAAFASVIPTTLLAEAVIDQLVQAFYVWQFYFTQMINPNMRGKNKETVQKAFETAVKAAMTSTNYPDTQRIDFLKKIGILTKTNELRKDIVALAEFWNALA